MSVEEERRKLENYAMYSSLSGYGGKENDISFNLTDLSDKETADVVRELVRGANFLSSGAVFSIPVFSAFTTTIELPWMPKEEIDRAIQFKAKQYIPVPISEVVYDWDFAGDSRIQKDKKMNSGFNGSGSAQVILVAVPKEIVNKYLNIAKLARLSVYGMESETFSLIRSVLGNDRSSSCLVDMGLRNTNIAIVENGSLMFNRNLDISGKEFTRIISQSIGVSFSRAEEMKRTEGLKNYAFDKNFGNTGDFRGEKEVSQILSPIVDLIVSEIDRMISVYLEKNKRGIDKIILAGGSSSLPGLSRYISKKTNKTVLVGDPLSRVVYPDGLNKIISLRMPSLAVAIGAATRSLTI